MLLYLHFSERANRIDNELSLDINEINLLNMIAKAYTEKRVIFVGDLISSRQMASQATLHKALKKLEAKNLIYGCTDTNDARKRKIILTSQAIQRYKKLEQAIIRACAV